MNRTGCYGSYFRAIRAFVRRKADANNYLTAIEDSPSVIRYSFTKIDQNVADVTLI